MVDRRINFYKLSFTHTNIKQKNIRTLHTIRMPLDPQIWTFRKKQIHSTVQAGWSKTVYSVRHAGTWRFQVGSLVNSHFQANLGYTVRLPIKIKTERGNMRKTMSISIRMKQPGKHIYYFSKKDICLDTKERRDSLLHWTTCTNCLFFFWIIKDWLLSRQEVWNLCMTWTTIVTWWKKKDATFKRRFT